MTVDRSGLKTFYDVAYAHDGFGAQRRYPNEELCRFMGRNFFGVEPANRGDVRMLEVGCGSGANLWMMAREGFDVHGVDLSPEAITLARQMLALYGTTATLAEADMTDCPYPAEHFDAIVDIFSSNCLDEQAYEQFVAETARLLRPGGRFFTYTPSKASDAFINHKPAKLIDARTIDGIARADAPFSGNSYAFRFTTPDEFAGAMERHGFQVAYSETVGRTYRGGAEYFEFVVGSAVKSGRMKPVVMES